MKVVFLGANGVGACWVFRVGGVFFAGGGMGVVCFAFCVGWMCGMA